MADSPSVTSEEGSDFIPKFAVPFLPEIAYKCPHLVQSSGIPGFRDELDAGQDRIGVNIPDDGGIRQGDP